MPKADQEVQQLVHKSRESLTAAELLEREGYHDFAVSRGYYAMFYMTEAVLLCLGMSFSKHAAVVAAFGQHLVQPGHVPQHLHRYLLDALDLRMVGDYDAPGTVGKKRTLQLLSWAKEFIRETARFLIAQGYAVSQENKK